MQNCPAAFLLIAMGRLCSLRAIIEYYGPLAGDC